MARPRWGPAAWTGLSNSRARIDVHHAQRGIGAVPHDRLDLALPHISLERQLGLSPHPEIEPRLGEAAARARLTFDIGVGPDGVQPLYSCHVDELVQVAVPGAAIIVEKQQPSTAINENPAGREDGGNIAKRADIEPEAGQEIG